MVGGSRLNEQESVKNRFSNLPDMKNRSPPSTAEHWMMASKACLFDDEESVEKIILANAPKTAKALGRKVSNFDDAVWKANARRLVTEGNVAKFSQTEEL